MAKYNDSYALVVYSGKKGSFEEEMFNKAIEGLKARNKEYKVIDLVADKFDPVYRGKDLALYSRADTTRTDVKEYQELVKAADELIFVYESKWNAVEKTMKGFFDQVFLANGFWYARKVAYFDALFGIMTWIKKWTVITQQDVTIKAKRNPMKKQIMKASIFALTMQNLLLFRYPKKKYIALSGTRTLTAEQKAAFLQKIETKVSK